MSKADISKDLKTTLSFFSKKYLVINSHPSFFEHLKHVLNLNENFPSVDIIKCLRIIKYIKTLLVLCIDYKVANVCSFE